MPDKPNKERSPRDEEPEPLESRELALPDFGMPGTFEDFMKPFNQYIQSVFSGSMGSLPDAIGVKAPQVDIQDRGTHFVLTAELPGYDRNDLEVRIGDSVLELKGEKKTEKETRGREGAKVQRSSSFIHRYMTLPEEVVSEKVTGTMTNGVLELKLPKKEPRAQGRSKKVDLK